MQRETFTDRLVRAITTKKSILNVGLDPQFDLMPQALKAWARTTYGTTLEAIGQLFLRFNKEIIDAVEPFAISVKPQIAFYESYGSWGMWAFEQTLQYAHKKGLQVITDAKRGDGSDTASAYADGHLGEVPFWGDGDTSTRVLGPIHADALTVQPGIGSACLIPFLDAIKKSGTGMFVVTKTSFKPNSEVEQIISQRSMPVWQEIAHLVSDLGKDTEGLSGYRNFGVVMGATYPEDALKMREILPNAWFLVPGYGAQGGGAAGAVAGVNPDGFGCVVNSSRGILYAYREGNAVDYAGAAAHAALASRDDLNAALRRAGKGAY